MNDALCQQIMKPYQCIGEHNTGEKVRNYIEDLTCVLIFIEFIKRVGEKR